MDSRELIPKIIKISEIRLDMIRDWGLRGYFTIHTHIP